LQSRLKQFARLVGGDPEVRVEAQPLAADGGGSRRDRGRDPGPALLA
jgi:hypothetical protein